MVTSEWFVLGHELRVAVRLSLLESWECASWKEQLLQQLFCKAWWWHNPFRAVILNLGLVHQAIFSACQYSPVRARGGGCGPREQVYMNVWYDDWNKLLKHFLFCLIYLFLWLARFTGPTWSFTCPGNQASLIVEPCILSGSQSICQTLIFRINVSMLIYVSMAHYVIEFSPNCCSILFAPFNSTWRHCWFTAIW